ncbi:MAG: hypothetical protein VYA84_08940 [Planctomycetota bacterium]|nr:hypothetical protein [Planctomycetota bacterium]
MRHKKTTICPIYKEAVASAPLQRIMIQTESFYEMICARQLPRYLFA